MNNTPNILPILATTEKVINNSCDVEGARETIREALLMAYRLGVKDTQIKIAEQMRKDQEYESQYPRL